ncbi:MAG: hypothetical protein R2822_27780 [Spirosomataceae bacterium]
MKNDYFNRSLSKIMRITLLQTLLMCVCYVRYERWGHSQEVLDRSVTVKAENIELKKMLSKIEGLTNVKFVYSSNVIRANQRVSVNATDKIIGGLGQVLTPIHTLSCHWRANHAQYSASRYTTRIEK